MRITTLPFLAVLAHGSSECTLNCKQNAPCVHGPADFSDHPTYQDGSPLEFHGQTSVNNMHCECPHGYTGLTCDRIFATCDGEHKCYNDGQVND